MEHLTSTTDDYQIALLKKLRNPVFASLYLYEIQKEGSQRMVDLAIRNVAEAMGFNRRRHSE